MGKILTENASINVIKENGEYTDSVLEREPGPDYVLFMHFPKLVDAAQAAFTLSTYVVGTPQDDLIANGYTKEEKRQMGIAGLYRRLDSFAP